MRRYADLRPLMRLEIEFFSLGISYCVLHIRRRVGPPLLAVRYSLIHNSKGNMHQGNIFQRRIQMCPLIVDEQMRF
jgi:hypothetical protein